MIDAVRGTRDLMGDDARYYRFIEDTARSVFEMYGFSEIIVPILEHTELFTRGIGDTTDIVTKEMYTFPDRKERSLTMRPEGTAGVVRSYIQNGLDRSAPIQKFYYSGPMFRYERPQKGRYRQFYQIGVEAFGVRETTLDADIIKMLADFLAALGIKDIIVGVNSIGCPACRPKFNDALVAYLNSKRSELCTDCNDRIERNPLRVLDCKNATCQSAIAGAPVLADHYCEECASSFTELKKLLTVMNIPFTINPRLVRGLDYYMRTVFEIACAELGAQNAIVGGGRYDGLVEMLGGSAIPGIGFAFGVDRLIDVLKEKKIAAPVQVRKVFVAWQLDDVSVLLRVADMLRKSGIQAEYVYEKKSFKSQLKQADKNGFNYVIFLGENEAKSENLHVKNMKTGEEIEIAVSLLSEILS